MPVDQALGRIGDALNQVTNRGERNALQWEILGRRGSELEAIMRRGTAGMAEMAAQAQRWGLTFTAADAAAIRSAQIAQRQADIALGSIRQSLANSLAAAAAPILEWVANLKVALVEVAQSGPMVALREGIAQAGRIAQAVIAGVNEAIQEWRPTLEDLKAAWVDAWNNIKRAMGSGEDFSGTMQGIAKLVTNFVLPTIVETARMVTWLANQGAAWIDVWKGRIQDMKEQFRGLFNYLSDAVIGFLRLAAALPNSLGGQQFTQALQTAQQVQAAVNNALNATFNLPAAAQSQAGGNPDINTTVRVRNQLTSMIAEQRKAMEGTGLTPLQQQLQALEPQIMKSARAWVDYRLAQEKWITPALLKSAAQWGNEVMEQHKAQVQQLNSLAAINDAMKTYQQLVGGAATPLDRFRQQVEQLDLLFIKGKVGQDEYARAAGQAAMQFEQTQRRQQVQLATGLTAGSAQAISLLNQVTVNQSVDPAQRLEQAIQQATQIQREQLYWIRDTGQRIRDGDIFRVAEIPR
jgi:hypothetical protein